MISFEFQYDNYAKITFLAGTVPLLKFFGSGLFYGSLDGVPQQQQLGYRNDKNTFFASVPVFTF